jgi:hypothetical protein
MIICDVVLEYECERCHKKEKVELSGRWDVGTFVEQFAGSEGEAASSSWRAFRDNKTGEESLHVCGECAIDVIEEYPRWVPFSWAL